MENNAIFNAKAFILGFLIRSINTINLIVKKGKRKDESSHLDFFTFTIVHFATYLTFMWNKSIILQSIIDMFGIANEFPF